MHCKWLSRPVAGAINWGSLTRQRPRAAHSPHHVVPVALFLFLIAAVIVVVAECATPLQATAMLQHSIIFAAPLVMASSKKPG
jgi:hypothetical protein